MKLTTDNLMRLAGLSALIAGTCYVLVGMFHPANIPSSVTTTRWEIVHVLACAMTFFGVLGMAGLYARQAGKTGWVGLAGLSRPGWADRSSLCSCWLPPQVPRSARRTSCVISPRAGVVESGPSDERLRFAMGLAQATFPSPAGAVRLAAGSVGSRCRKSGAAQPSPEGLRRGGRP